MATDRNFPDPDELDALVDDVLATRGDAEVADTGSADPEVASAGVANDPEGVTAAMRRVRELADEPLPAASQERHLHRIETHRTRPRPHTPVGVGRRGHRQVRGGTRRRLVAVMAGALALMMLTAGSAVAVAQDAAPDDALYGVKRASEQAWLTLSRDEERAAEVHLALAERRLEEARRAPEHAQRLVAEGVENAEAAADERPEEAIENFKRLLGVIGDDPLPESASDNARAAHHRNCVRIAERHGLGSDQCGPQPDVEHPGKGLGQRDGEHPGRGQGEGRPDHPGQGMGRSDGDGPRGWGEGGRPDGAVGPPPGTPGHERFQERGGDDDEEPTTEE